MPKRDDLESQALTIITEKGDEGVLQSALWRELNASSREGSRISLKLEKKNLIKREKELFNGRWTYRLYISKRPIQLESVIDIPCVSCPEIFKCEAESEVSPNRCSQLNQWLLTIQQTS